MNHICSVIKKKSCGMDLLTEVLHQTWGWWGLQKVKMKTKNSLNIDYLLEKDPQFWEELSIKKYAEVNALSLTKEKVEDVIPFHDKENVLQNLEEILITIDLLDINIIESEMFSLKITSKTFKLIIEEIKNIVKTN